MTITTTTRCMNPRCNNDQAWHARRANWMRENLGPEAELGFEQDHPWSEDEPAPDPMTATVGEIVGWLEQQPDGEDYLVSINQGYPASETLGLYLADHR